MNKEKIEQLLNLLEGITFKEWQIIEQYINNEYKRLANKNTLTNSESIVKNIIMDLD